MSSVGNDPIYAWYEQKRKEASALSAELARVRREKPQNKQLIRRLEQELERASYVGD